GPPPGNLRKLDVDMTKDPITLTALPGCSRRQVCRVAQIFVLIAVGCMNSSTLAQTTPQNLDWPNYGNDLANTRFQNVDQINPTNVTNLRVAWVFHTGVLDPQASLEVSPIVVNGIMFVSSGHDDVFAVHGDTGKLQWAYHPTDMPLAS